MYTACVGCARAFSYCRVNRASVPPSLSTICTQPAVCLHIIIICTLARRTGRRATVFYSRRRNFRRSFSVAYNNNNNNTQTLLSDTENHPSHCVFRVHKSIYIYVKCNPLLKRTTQTVEIRKRVFSNSYTHVLCCIACVLHTKLKLTDPCTVIGTRFNARNELSVYLRYRAWLDIYRAAIYHDNTLCLRFI